MFDKNLTGDNIKEIIEHINHWYGAAQNNKNRSGQHLTFEAFDAVKGFVTFLQSRLEEIGDKDLMNASYSTLPKDVFLVSGEPLQSPAAKRSTSVLYGLTPTKKIIDTEKQKVMAAILDKTTKASSLLEVQKESEDVNYKKRKHELQQLLDKNFDELEQIIFVTSGELRIVERNLLRTHNTLIEIDDYNHTKNYLLIKLNRYQKKMDELKTTMNINN